MVGVLKSRAMKGMSVGERPGGGGTRLYKELRDLHDKLNKSLDGESEREAAVARLEEAIAEMREQLRAPDTLSEYFARRRRRRRSTTHGRLGASTLAGSRPRPTRRSASLRSRRSTWPAERLSSCMSAAKNQEQQLTPRCRALRRHRRAAGARRRHQAARGDARHAHARRQTSAHAKPLRSSRTTPSCAASAQAEAWRGSRACRPGLSDVSVTPACYADAGEALPALADSVTKPLKRTETEYAS